MTPQFNSIPHSPPNSYGNCFSACLASLLDLPVDEVPHFYGDPSRTPNECLADARKWLGERQLTLVQAIFPPETALDDLLTALGMMNPGQRFLLTGKSTVGCGHTVIARDGEIEHDPTGSQIIGPIGDWWWVEFIGKAV